MDAAEPRTIVTDERMRPGVYNAAEVASLKRQVVCNAAEAQHIERASGTKVHPRVAAIKAPAIPRERID